MIKAIVITAVMLMISGCDTYERAEFHPGLGCLYFKDDIQGLYDLGTGFTGLSIALSRNNSGDYYITAQSWSDLGNGPMHTTTCKLINGSLILERPLSLPTLDEYIKTRQLFIHNIIGNPVITANEFYNKNNINHNECKDLFFRSVDFPDGLKGIGPSERGDINADEVPSDDDGLSHDR